MRFTLGVDIGTFESKGVLVDGEGTIIVQATCRHEMIVPQSGWAEHRADDDWWGDFVTITKALLQQSGVDPAQIACVAASAIGPCMLPVDADGRPLMNGILYGVDTRAAVEIDELNDRIGADLILTRCGNALTSQSVGPKILWLRKNRPEIFEQTARILTSTSYLTWKLTGEMVIDHYTAANFSPLYDVGTQDWTTDLASDIVDPTALPRLMWSTEIAGHVTSAAAQETGLAQGTPVTCGTIDAAAEAISVGVSSPGDTMMMYGSTVFVVQVTSERISDARLWYAPWLFPGLHASLAGLATSGTLTHWFRDQFARELERDAAFPVLVAEADAAPPGANGLLFLPYFSGERTPIHDAKAKGAFFGLDLTHQRGDLFRAVIEGIANATAHVFESYRDAGVDPARVMAVGGGTQNRIWLEATSNIGSVTQLVCEKTVGASYGNAFLAAFALGHAERDEIAAWNPVRERIVPVPDAALKRQYELFKRLYVQTRDIAHQLG